jgi:Zn-dependent peptidase ImmA (M78 family)/transcriptional regulator with XRE-family HTH domain
MSEQSHTVATRLAEVRSLSNLNQAELAKKVGVSSSLISHWEKGTRVPSAAQLMELARQLGVALDYLLNSEVSPDFQCRAKATRHDQSPDVDRALLNAAEQIHFVNTALRLAQKTPRPFNLCADFSSVPDLPNFAGHLRDTLKLNRRVTLSEMKQALSEWNVFVFDWNMPWHLSGLSYRGPFTAIFINHLHPPTRRLFTLSHEFAHVLFHLGRETQDDTGKKTKHDTAVSIASNKDPQEKQANAFAAEFLMPSAAIKELVEKRGRELRNVAQLDEAARRFNVSRDALFYRLTQHNLFGWKEKSRYFSGEFRPPPPPQERVATADEIEAQVDPAFLQIALSLLNEHKISSGKVAEWFFAPRFVVDDYLSKLDAGIDLAISNGNDD